MALGSRAKVQRIPRFGLFIETVCHVMALMLFSLVVSVVLCAWGLLSLCYTGAIIGPWPPVYQAPLPFYAEFLAVIHRPFRRDPWPFV